jgi:hypothetical protein
MLNIPLHALAYVLTPKYYHVSWLSSPATGGGSKKKPNQDPKVQNGYMTVLEKMVLDEECDTIWRQLSQYILSHGAFGTNLAIRDRGNLNSLEWWNMHGRVAHSCNGWQHGCFHKCWNTSSAERCWSTYNFIHRVKRNKLNVNWSESLVYVHYNLQLLSRYCEEAKMDKNLKHWDNNPEENNLEDGVLLLEQLENALLDDDDDHDEMPPPSTSMVPMSRTPGTALGASSSLPSQSSTSTSAQFYPSQEAPLPPQGGPCNNRGGGRRMG